jgi:sarcosine oxidase
MFDFDTAIIGGGISGMSAAYYSSARGMKTLLLEKNSFRNDIACSKGNSRFFRIMYSSEESARLAEIALSLWRQLEEELGVTLIDKTPLLFMGDKECGNTVEGDFSNLDKVMDRMGIPYEKLNSSGLKEKFPIFHNIPDSYEGYIQKDCGVINVQNALKGFQKLAEQKGAVLKENCEAKTISPLKGGGFVLKTDEQEIKCKYLIIAASLWTNDVIDSLGLKLHQTIWETTVCYFKSKNTNLSFPFWYEFGRPKNKLPSLFYGFPAGTDIKNMVKVSADFILKELSHPDECSNLADPKIESLIKDFIKERFANSLDLNNFESTTCKYGMSEDYKIIIGCLPGYKNAAILTGESGRAFKFAPLLGRMLNDFAINGETYYPHDEMSINRIKFSNLEL